jgi:L-alanine-DL-glutamate epimerase-like enolase superfamily enzyme
MLERSDAAVIESIGASSLTIPFKLSFKHASAARASTQTIWVRAKGRDGRIGFGEGCPREYVTGESLQSAQAFVAAHSAGWRDGIRDVESLAAWIRAHEREIDANPAAWSAVELALLDLFGKSAGTPVEALLGLPPLGGRFRYTAVLGDASPGEFEGHLARYCQVGFRDFKIKLAGERTRDLAKARALQAAGVDPRSVRADANNLWSDAGAAIDDLAALGFAFFALEEPLRAGDYAGMARIARARDSRIVLDESMARAGQLPGLPGPAESWLVNLRVSKMGGLLRSLDFLREARRQGLRVIVGAHVGETSLLTRAALTVASAAGEALVAQEGAFGTHLLEHDVVERPLMFGAGGILDASAAAIGAAPGWGLAIREAPQVIPR